MRWLLAEDWTSHIYAEPFLRRLSELGEEVHAFREREFFRTSGHAGRLGALLGVASHAQHRLRAGPRVARLNLALLSRVESIRPDVLFVFRGEHLWPSTLAAAKQRGVYLVGWHNDNPFSPLHPWYAWRHFRRSIPLYDRLYAYRWSNLADFARAGCPRCGLLRSFYLREWNHPLANHPKAGFAYDVSFSGHWEADGRDRYVAALLAAPEINFRLAGTLWERSPLAPQLRQHFGKVEPLYHEAYNTLLGGSRIALAFLSGLNQDTYTRRCFEIPAAKAFMLAQYTPDLASLFIEGKEAEYFRGPAEMMEKTRHYLAHDQERRQIAEAGHLRLLADGHEALDRARVVRDDVLADQASRGTVSAAIPQP